MKILFIVPRYHTNLFFVTKALLEFGHDVYFITFFNLPLEDYSLTKPIIIDKESLNAAYVEHLLDHLAPNMVLIRNYDVPYRLFCKVARKKRIKTLLYDQLPYKRKMGRLFFKECLARFPMHRFTPVLGLHNARMKDIFATYIPFPMEPLCDKEKRVYCMNNSVRILCIAKLGQPRKRHLLLLDALEKIGMPCSLTFVGLDSMWQGADLEYYKALEKRCRQSNLSGGVRIIKNLSFRDTLQLYRQYDLFVLPAINEPISISALEAMAAGCAVVISEDNGASGYIDHGVDGYLFEPYNYSHFTRILKELMSDKILIENIGKNAFEKVKLKHDKQTFVRRIVSLYS